ncbi:hypothetical protein SAMN05192540_3500 [Maribacter dokdonensis]|uniref:Lipoprotein n=1 Tax=Maribacter dokdonensis TaxID=320912 RepID=A0A1H4TL05_9FLAO|nr:hypothetical protein [Maribacter dokdonensis]SEC56938.1 hypothetical protein SAMN05192540_3500 [Maribacter dokdonensis]
MNLRNLLFLLALTMISGCGCTDDVTLDYQLTDFEKSLIPFDSDTEVEFITDGQVIIKALNTEKTIEIMDLNFSDDESCMSTLIEIHENELIFENEGKQFGYRVAKNHGNSSNIGATDGIISYCAEETTTENLEERLTNISTDGFEFNNVIVLNSIDNSTFIVCKANRGIEFIKNSDVSYLKRVE